MSLERSAIDVLPIITASLLAKDAARATVVWRQRAPSVTITLVSADAGPEPLVATANVALLDSGTTDLVDVSLATATLNSPLVLAAIRRLDSAPAYLVSLEKNAKLAPTVGY